VAACLWPSRITLFQRDVGGGGQFAAEEFDLFTVLGLTGWLGSRPPMIDTSLVQPLFKRPWRRLKWLQVRFFLKGDASGVGGHCQMQAQ
jgi:hypothetical protein